MAERSGKVCSEVVKGVKNLWSVSRGCELFFSVFLGVLERVSVRRERFPVLKERIFFKRSVLLRKGSGSKGFGRMSWPCGHILVPDKFCFLA
ncbi:hypothetical protein COLO4_13021 [Corchorus olitorius]|uniref:Uncharacterized protein n=1 Tax=Corchorus olitorius TaxID=93759 RepID=A0A1R3JYJ3_9ROSI|nr:hypothetical protein COLO4_13021 [Corchorus olitorius]